MPTDSEIAVYNIWRDADGAAAFAQEPWARRRAGEALRRAEVALADYERRDAVDPYHLADLMSARDLARAVCAAVEEDEQRRHQR